MQWSKRENRMLSVMEVPAYEQKKRQDRRCIFPAVWSRYFLCSITTNSP